MSWVKYFIAQNAHITVAYFSRISIWIADIYETSILNQSNKTASKRSCKRFREIKYKLLAHQCIGVDSQPGRTFPKYIQCQVSSLQNSLKLSTIVD